MANLPNRLRPVHLIIVLLAIILGIGPLLGFYTDYLWFGAVGYRSVFTKKITWQILTLLIGFLLSFIFLYLNIRFARNTIEGILSTMGFQYTEIDGRLILAGTGILSFLFGLTFSGNWETILLYLNKTPFGVTEPVLNKDVGFYIFQIPFLDLIRTIFLGLFFISIVITGIIYAYRIGPILLPEEDIINSIPTKVLIHISILLGGIFGLIAFGFYLNRFELLFSEQGVVAGAGFTDVNIRLPIFIILTILSAITALALVANIKLKDVRIPLAGIGLIIIFLLAGSVVPGVYQQLRVTPNELQLEKPYLQNNIDYTREAFGLSEIKEKQFEIDANLTTEDLEGNEDVIENIRIWDRRALIQTYRQLQQIRTYYTFNDVDTDRYHVNGEYRQYMISARELNLDALDPSASTWINEKLVYTHGYGLVMNPVSEKTPDGRPNLVLRDIPPTGDFQLENPRIYYGEETNSYKLVDTGRSEFDYPRSGENAFNNYGGTGGVQINSFIRKFIYMIRFGEIKFLLSDEITSGSQLMYDRQIQQRVEKIAPFLSYDSDPYPVMHDGKIKWIIDAYTTAERYPYSERYQNLGYNNINYMRNSVKVVIDSYEGSVDFYMINKVPIAETYSKIFPELFKEYSEMPQELKNHIRYPKDFFKVQMDLYRNYHMKDPATFYNKEDAWEIPTENYRGDTTKMEPYYLLSELPDKDELEYLLVQPFTPRNRQNMLSWVAARSDEPNYGEINLYEFPRGQLVYGPNQIESRIDQDPDISEQLTLWGQTGSSVIRGNLLVIPIGNSVLYTEPILISAEQSEIPELRRVVASSGQNTVMEENLQQSLQMLIQGKIEDGGDGETPIPGTAKELAQQALEHYNRAQEYLQEGNWTGYGQEIEKVRNLLDQLSNTLGNQTIGNQTLD